ncbi:MAG: DUF1015 family protein [Bacteroidota bacterium]|nr:DUF1015 family protein [Bacteroidota bacterium]
MFIKPFKYTHPDFKAIIDNDIFFDQIKHNFPELKKAGAFIHGKRKSIFVYRIKTKTRMYHGVLAGVDIQDYISGNIKKHENTLIAQEENISSLMKLRNAIIKPVLLAYPQRKSIKDLMVKSFLGKKPTFRLHFLREDQIHEFYAVKDPLIVKSFQKEFKSKVKKAYIADGHHRMASVSRLLEQNPELASNKLNYLLCALFDFDELSILPYNRTIKILDQVHEEDIYLRLTKLAKVTVLEKMRAPRKEHELIFHFSHISYSVEWNADTLKYFKSKHKISQDVAIFNELVVKDIFGIKDYRNNSRIKYIEGIKPLKLMIKMVEDQEHTLAVSFFPIKVRDFIKVADSNLVLPPKSTWFEPRIKNGIIIQDFDS